MRRSGRSPWFRNGLEWDLPFVVQENLHRVVGFRCVYGGIVINQLKTVRRLVRRPVAGGTVFSVIGSFVVAGLDMLGVAAMLPLMQVVTGASESPLVQAAAGTLGSSEPRVLVPAIAAVVAGAFVLKSLMTIAFRWWQLGFTAQLETEASTELMRRYLQAPYWAHRQRKLGEVHRSIESFVPQTFSHVVQGLLNWLTDALTLAAIAVVLVFVSPIATALAVLVIAGSGWAVQRVLRPRFRRIGEVVARTELEAWSALMPGISGFREVRLAGASAMLIARFSRAKTERARARREQSLASELPKYVLEVSFVVGIGLIAGVLFATQAPGEAVAVIGVFAAGSTRILPTVNRLVATTGLIRSGQHGLSVLCTELNELEQQGQHPASPPSVLYDGDIVLDQVTYCFPDSREPVLRDVSTVIKHGTTTAFVGSSGAGKSTLLDLVLGLLAPTAGMVTCGGRDIHEDLNGWYSGIAVVPQDVFLLDDTLEANITLGEDGTADPERLGEAVRLAQLGPVLEDLPRGLSTRLGERGVRLSGGQRQRVGIARALYRRPRLLVLDEATSALDNATEQRITETIERLSGLVTVVIVAHRLSSVRKAGTVVFMAEGSVAAEGTFAEVEAQSPQFSELVSLGRV